MENSYLFGWYLDLLTRYYGHEKAEDVYRRRHRLFGVPVVVVTTIVGTAAFASLDGDAGKIWIVAVLMGTFSVSAAVLSALQTFLQYGELAEKHRAAMARCAKLKIDFEQKLLRGNTQEGQDFIDEVAQSWCTLQEESPNLPEKIRVKAIVKARDRINELQQTVYRESKCEGTLADLFVWQDSKLVEVPSERLWRYELEDVRLQEYESRMKLEFLVNAHRPGKNDVEQYKCRAVGSYTNGIGFLEYRFNQTNGTNRWRGVMVLHIPMAGEIVGLWATANVMKYPGFPMGSISLRRTSVNQISEEGMPITEDGLTAGSRS